MSHFFLHCTHLGAQSGTNKSNGLDRTVTCFQTFTPAGTFDSPHSMLSLKLNLCGVLQSQLLSHHFPPFVAPGLNLSPTSCSKGLNTVVKYHKITTSTLPLLFPEILSPSSCWLSLQMLFPVDSAWLFVVLFFVFFFQRRVFKNVLAILLTFSLLSSAHIADQGGCRLLFSPLLTWKRCKAQKLYHFCV